MISSHAALDAVTAHLFERGFEVDKVTQLFGGTPSMTTKPTESTPRLLIHLMGGFTTCCSPKREPDEWEAEAAHLREGIERIRARLDFKVRWNEVVCCMSVRGSVHDHADQLSALSEELGIRLIAIDEDLHVESAGL